MVGVNRPLLADQSGMRDAGVSNAFKKAVLCW
jgi:hypothetical protein